MYIPYPVHCERVMYREAYHTSLNPRLEQQLVMRSDGKMEKDILFRNCTNCKDSNEDSV